MRGKPALLLLLAVLVFTLAVPESGAAGLDGLTPPPDKAVVIVYREKKLKASAARYKTYVNDVPVAVLTNGTWSGVVIQPGSYDLWIELFNPRGLVSRAVSTFEWDAGRIYFIKEDSHFISDGLTWRADATLIEEEAALKEIEKLEEAESLVAPPGRKGNGMDGFFFIDLLPRQGE